MASATQKSCRTQNTTLLKFLLDLGHGTGCGNCCSGPASGFVWVNDEEIQSLANKLGMTDTDAFERKFVRRVGNRKSLVEYSDGDCIFLDPRLQSRPTLFATRSRSHGSGQITNLGLVPFEN